MARAFVFIAALCGLLACANAAFYLPGVSPVGYAYKVKMYVNKITSTKAQLPFRYYSLPFCQPDAADHEEADLNLGEILSGDSIESSVYEFYTKYNEFCKTLCRRQYSAEEAGMFAEKIEQEYTVHWILDNLPAAVRMYDEADPDEIIYERGFPLGFMDGPPGLETAYLFNHIRFVIKFNADEEEDTSVRIVGFEVEPFSVRHSYEGAYEEGQTQLTTCNDAQPVTRNMAKQAINAATEVIYTYDVKWEKSHIPWSERWELYLRNTSDDGVHWFSITNSLLVVLLLTGMIAMIMVRVIRKDIARYNDERGLEEAAEETGWKLVHGDVFRGPEGTFGPVMLSVFVGSGIQILMMACSVMVFAVLGFLSPANRGGMMTALLLLFVFNGAFGGYYSARLYKSFGSRTPTRTTLLTALLFPGMVCATAFIVNLFVWSEGSSSAIPIGTMFALLVLWLGVSTPLVFLGAFFGYRKDALKAPVRVKEVARAIPPQPWYLTTWPSALVGGILPFGAVFIELFFIMASLWEEQTYYVFGFLLLSVVILLITCAEISVVMCYFQLCSENHRWWWRAFLTSGSSALYLFLYSGLYFFTKLDISNFAAILMYFGNMAIITGAFFLLTGSIGFVACYIFVRIIYGAIKID